MAIVIATICCVKKKSCLFSGLAVLLVLAWRIAGYIGLDYYLLPRLAELWTPANAKE